MAEIRTVAVIGAGVAGRRIAQAVARAGYRTILQDILPSRLRTAEAELTQQAQVHPDAAAIRIEYAATVEDAARQADLVIEAVPDELESKLEIFTLLDKLCKPETILASNTSTLTITEIASVTYRLEKCIAMRFTTPMPNTNRLELVRGRETDEETVTACAELGTRMGKNVVVLSETG